MPQVRWPPQPLPTAPPLPLRAAHAPSVTCPHLLERARDTPGRSNQTSAMALSSLKPKEATSRVPPPPDQDRKALPTPPPLHGARSQAAPSAPQDESEEQPSSEARARPERSPLRRCPASQLHPGRLEEGTPAGRAPRRLGRPPLGLHTEILVSRGAEGCIRPALCSRPV